MEKGAKLYEGKAKKIYAANDDGIVWVAHKDSATAFNGKKKREFQEKDVRLIDSKLEFGKDAEGNILLADEISPDTCRLWDLETNQRLDKD